MLPAQTVAAAAASVVMMVGVAEKVAAGAGPVAGLRSGGQARDDPQTRLYRRALRASEEVHGLQHALVGAACANLALAAYRRADFACAEEMLRRALAIADAQANSATAAITTTTAAVAKATAHMTEVESCLSGLGRVLYRRAKYAEAEGMFQRALEARCW